MTLNTAKREAKRRTDDFLTSHYVLRYASITDETAYIVSSRIPKGYKVFAEFQPFEAA